MVLEKTLESPVDCKEIQPVHPKGDQSLIFIGRTDTEAETPILWPPDAKNWLTGKDPDAGKDWRWEEKETTEDEMVGWHHRLNGHGFGWTPGVGDGQGGLVCFSPWGCKGLDTTEQLNWTELIHKLLVFGIYTHLGGRQTAATWWVEPALFTLGRVGKFTSSSKQISFSSIQVDCFPGVGPTLLQGWSPSGSFSNPSWYFRKVHFSLNSQHWEWGLFMWRGSLFPHKSVCENELLSGSSPASHRPFLFSCKQNLTGVGSRFLLQGIFPGPGIEPRFPASQAGSLPAEPPACRHRTSSWRFKI